MKRFFALSLLPLNADLGLFITMMVAWGFHHGMRFSGPNAGEMPFAYAFCFLLLVFAGAGKYSLDRKFGF